jgi:phosphoglycolate phosphatase
MARVQAVLFDLDGTLVDSAPDLAGAINDLRLVRGLDALPYAQLRPMVGSGARGMVGVAFGLAPGNDGFEALKDAFLARYEQRLLQETAVFAAMHEVLQRLETNLLPWGIVTNKALRFAEPLVRGLNLHHRSVVLIGGDSTPFTKPHPEPLLEAARRIGISPSNCVYVGDDLRDVRAGKAAGMATLAAAWGYLGQDDEVDRWGADAVVAQPEDLLQWLDLA